MKIDQRILSLMRKAIQDKKMIDEGDRIAVGLSGGKDSTVLLAALAAYRRFSPFKFSLFAITVDMGLERIGFEAADFTPLKQLCAELDVEYHIEKTDIAEIVFKIRKETNPCALCSKLRRGILNSLMNKLGLNKLALGHHADDLMETFLLSLLYEGRLSALMPKSFMNISKITLIRPLIYVEEKTITAAAKDFKLIHNPCPANRKTKREYMKNLIKSLQNDNGSARTNIFRALINPSRNNLWEL